MLGAEWFQDATLQAPFIWSLMRLIFLLSRDILVVLGFVDVIFWIRVTVDATNSEFYAEIYELFCTRARWLWKITLWVAALEMI